MGGHGLPRPTSMPWHLVACVVVAWAGAAAAVRCYQCSTDQDRSGKDLCGAFRGFNKSEHALVECTGFEAVTPGTFCVKQVHESPGVWGYWRTVHRRCAQISESGVTWGCFDWEEENGVHSEVCYCDSDGCNGSEPLGGRGKLPVYVGLAIASSVLLTVVWSR